MDKSEQPRSQNACHYCNDDDRSELNRMYGLDHILPGYRFCPMCGRRIDGETDSRPLMLDELREMDGMPVWLKSIVGGYAEWGIIRITEHFGKLFFSVGGAEHGFGDADNYGKTWLAYCYKPEGVSI